MGSRGLSMNNAKIKKRACKKLETVILQEENVGNKSSSNEKWKKEGSTLKFL